MFNGSRVKLVREMRGLTQKVFAESLGVKQSAVTQIENGLIMPSEETREKIALKTGFPLGFFRKPDAPEFPFGSLLFRARLKSSQHERKKACAYAKIIYDVVSDLEQYVENKISMNIFRHKGSPEDAARLTRSHFRLSPDTPIKNLSGVLEKNGIVILILPVKPEGCDAFSVWVSSRAGEQARPILSVAKNCSADRMRFSLSHELAHLILGHEQIGDYGKIEKDANRFASEFLMPEEVMMDEIESPVSLASLMKLKVRWGVSIQALIRRSFDIGKITTQQYRYLMRQMGMRNWRKQEPVSIPKEVPRFVSQIVEIIYGKPINFKALAKDTSMPVALLEEIFGAYYHDNAVSGRNAVEEHHGKVRSFSGKQL